MTKWDTIQADLEPITPKIWGDEHEFDNDINLDDDNDLVLDWRD